jgi:N-acetylglucosamine kinase-like BadF-type ATPase
VRAALDKTPLGQLARRDDLWLGVDGGGSRTVALLATRGSGTFGEQVLGRGESGASNLRAVGEEQAVRALDEAVTRAFAAAGLMRVPVRAACLGVAGAGREEEQRVLGDWAMRVNLATHVEVLPDVALLLLAGTPDGWGVGVVAGTGSIAYGRAVDGRTARAGGWGSLLGDEGSGYALALGGLQAVARAADGRGPATMLTKLLLAGLGVQEPQGLIARLYNGGWDRVAVARLTPLVLDAAEQGDAVARELVEDGAKELAEAAAAVVRKLEFDPTAVPVALSGGLLLERPSYRERLQRGLVAIGIQGIPVTLVAEPARGAVRLARSMG